jgi:hypothetical protein
MNAHAPGPGQDDDAATSIHFQPQPETHAQAQAQKQKPRRNTLSNIFALVAVVFAILAVVLYLRPGRGVAPLPVAGPGGNQIVNVTNALKAQGLEVEQPPGHFIPAGEVSVPGQGVEINGAPGYIFLFPNADKAQTEVDGVSPSRLVPTELRGTPQPEGERRAVLGSNVVVVLVGGDDETWNKVQAAVATLA